MSDKRKFRESLKIGKISSHDQVNEQIPIRIVAYGYKGDRIDINTALGIGAFNNRLGPFSFALSHSLEKKLALKKGDTLLLHFSNGKKMVGQFDDRIPASSICKLIRKHGKGARFTIDVYMPWGNKKEAYSLPEIAKLEVIRKEVDPSQLEKDLIQKGLPVYERAKRWHEWIKAQRPHEKMKESGSMHLFVDKQIKRSSFNFLDR
ncbi:hypothetical protein A7K93_02365 [Candidatus Methylacidiphilum fumarolicum]|uniref:Uncharacterized protein n=2 Tax=Candidatus Methylacidiphilum fumarolicum TaxID=591154 RepID=I0JVF2_METFB|nr:hypothetical protein [Candidatus Methylacidiphilum fumarolicum]MBW6414875.1 hypothetical protein [Candidatus Methylacidiphilum fumarolicum]TFE68315.1 hypothetical protein A7K73_00840 [Candidatus Methylacidiphilum fumarolicum]TFE73540.1 hypothetical protein A7K72_06480 [Candidatus Methylacidiphilum fumarolicum]TFE74999.1 hypothetical protein A7K93_02365 [Candidatus Methylacidiphilum fumarolicum]TFE76542.1 hypothetical protein A7D33_09370 [Candidatus Methylacidiphilum fumarolicum]